jgi:dTDP-4-amino-4,6-dideoxygalactose transaminase
MSFHCPVAKNLASHLIALPLGVDMTDKDVDFVVTALKEAIDESTRSGD